MSLLCTHARSQSLSALADSRVIDSLLQIIPHLNEALLQLVDVTYTTFMYTLLHDSPDLVVDRVQIWAVWRPERSGPMKSGVSCCCSWMALRVRCVGALSCWHV